MFIGHFGVAFGAKKYAPKVSLGILFIATQFIEGRRMNPPALPAIYYVPRRSWGPIQE